MRIGVLLFLMFTVVPAFETWLLITVGSRIGALNTVLYLIGAGVLGAWLGRRAGGALLGELFADLRKGLPPADRLVEGALVLVGGVLLVTPGILSDAVGVLLFIAPLRRWLAPRVRAFAGRWLTARGVHVGDAAPGPAARARATAEKRTFDHPTV